MDPDPNAPKKNPVVRCPICGNSAPFFDEPVGPFCSARCKMVDLSKWLNEEYCISDEIRPEHFAEFEDLDIPSEER